MAGQPHTKLTADIEIKGAVEGAAKLDQVADAQARVAGETTAAVVPAEQLDQAQQKLNTSSDPYISILSRIHPSLGAMASVMVNTIRIAGDLANQQIHLRGVTELVLRRYSIDG